MKNYKIIFIILILISCRKDINDFKKSLNISFSTDSVMFDTIFTTTGSITKKFSVYNNSNYDIKIDEINLASSNSPFRINVDGNENYASNINIRANDSIFIFVEVTINPNNSNNPLIHLDSISFRSRNKSKYLKLIAWGQDAHFHTSNSYILIENSENSQIDTFHYHKISQNSIWTNDKPHVIIGNLIIENGATLEILDGVKIYLHYNSNIIVGEFWESINNKSSIKINGNYYNSIQITSDRLDEYYNELPGQWGKIWLTSNSDNNEITNTLIKNGQIGIHIDTISQNISPKLKIENCVITNHSYYGILSYSSKIEAINCFIFNNLINNVFLFAGGDYNFIHCNLLSNNQYPSLRMSNFYEDIFGNEQIRPMINANFINTVVHGNLENEIFIEKTEFGDFNYLFKNSLVKVDPNTVDTSNYEVFSNVIFNQNPRILNLQNIEYDFQIDSISPLINSGDNQISILYPNDIFGNNRINDKAPDIGAIEKVY